MGVSFDSCIFKQHNSTDDETRLTVMVGGDPDINEYGKQIHSLIIDENNKDIEKLCLETIKKHLKINDTPSEINTIFNFNAIPQYNVGHDKLLNQMDNIFKK